VDLQQLFTHNEYALQVFSSALTTMHMAAISLHWWS